MSVLNLQRIREEDENADSHAEFGNHWICNLYTCLGTSEFNPVVDGR